MRRATLTVAGWVLGSLLLVAMGPRVASAQETDERVERARALFEEAEAHFAAGRFLPAAAAYESSYELMHEAGRATAPLILYNVGRAYDRAGQVDQMFGLVAGRKDGEPFMPAGQLGLWGILEEPHAPETEFRQGRADRLRRVEHPFGDARGPESGAIGVGGAVAEGCGQQIVQVGRLRRDGRFDGLEDVLQGLLVFMAVHQAAGGGGELEFDCAPDFPGMPDSLRREPGRRPHIPRFSPAPLPGATG